MSVDLRPAIETRRCTRRRSVIFVLAVALVVGAVLCLSGCTRVIIQEPPNNEGEGPPHPVGTTSTTARLETATSLTVITGPGSVSGQVSPAEAVAIVVGTQRGQRGGGGNPPWVRWALPRRKVRGSSSPPKE